MIGKMVVRALKRNGVEPKLNPAIESWSTKAFVQGLGGDLLLTTMDEHPLAGNLQRVMSLNWMPITILGRKRFDFFELEQNLNCFFTGKIAVFNGGFSYWYLKNLGLSLPSLPVADCDKPADLAERVLSGESDCAIASTYHLKVAQKRWKGLSLSDQRLTTCDHSAWVREGEDELADWLYEIFAKEQESMRPELREFAQHHKGTLVPSFHPLRNFL
jgi:hypothetical protein